MKKADLVAALRDMDDDAEVLLAFQPHWPFEYTIEDVVEVGDSEDGTARVYLAEGGQKGYLSGDAREELGW